MCMFQSCTNMSSHFLANHIVLRERECILEGTQVQWTDRVFCDGTIFLSLDRTDNWTAHVPQALPLKGLLEQAEQQATNYIRLEEGCARLMRELKLSEEHSGEHVYIDVEKESHLNQLKRFFLLFFFFLFCHHAFGFVDMHLLFLFFPFSFQTTAAPASDTALHICNINWTNLAQLSSL